MWTRIVAGVVGGLIVALLAGNMVDCLFDCALVDLIVALSLLALTIVFAVRSSSAYKVLRWTFIASASLCFMVPLVALAHGILHNLSVAATVINVGVFAIIFFLMGLAFLVIGLLLGRNTRSH